MLVDIAVEEIVMSVGCLHKLLVDASMKILPSLSGFSFRLCRDLLRFLRSSDRNLDIVKLGNEVRRMASSSVLSLKHGQMQVA